MVENEELEKKRQKGRDKVRLWRAKKRKENHELHHQKKGEEIKKCKDNLKNTRKESKPVNDTMKTSNFLYY